MQVWWSRPWAAPALRAACRLVRGARLSLAAAAYPNAPSARPQAAVVNSRLTGHDRSTARRPAPRNRRCAGPEQPEALAAINPRRTAALYPCSPRAPTKAGRSSTDESSQLDPGCRSASFSSPPDARAATEAVVRWQRTKHWPRSAHLALRHRRAVHRRGRCAPRCTASHPIAPVDKPAQLAVHRAGNHCPNTVQANSRRALAATPPAHRIMGGDKAALPSQPGTQAATVWCDPGRAKSPPAPRFVARTP